MASRTFDGGFAFQVALHADVITPRGSQLGGVDDRTTVDVCGSGAVAAFASYSVVSERRLGIAVVGAGRGRPHPAYVAMQATRVGGKVQRDLACGLVGGGHVPDLLVGVPVHGRLEEESVGLKQIASATASGADVVEQLALTLDFGIARAVETQPASSVLGVDAVVNAGFLVGEFGGRENVDSGTAGGGHGRALVGFIDGGMAAGASLVADIAVTAGGFERWIRCWILCRGTLLG